ncbi:MAG: hypothetical protein MUO31_06820 [Thermodesulfovibrionales bacterium]|nr:hypothetical protein [Thermodesulfovibrionales bacterium]
MAGIDLASQYAGTIPGAGRTELGYFDVSSGSWTVEVPTRLVTCFFGLGIADYDTGGDNNTLIFPTDCIITSGAVTFRRTGPYNLEDERFRYMLCGF